MESPTSANVLKTNLFEYIDNEEKRRKEKNIIIDITSFVSHGIRLRLASDIYILCTDTHNDEFGPDIKKFIYR